MYLFNLFIVSLWALSGIFSRNILFMVPVVIYEIIKAPIRLTIDYLFNSFTRTVGVCVGKRNTYFGYTTRDIYGGYRVKVAYNNSRNFDSFTVDAPSDIDIGDCLIYIKGRFSRKTIDVENSDCIMKF
ncbi:MAG: hypothetical protein Q4F66_13470 [Clostridium sp.]|nr:hypothetical protein [Clostridium sp.]